MEWIVESESLSDFVDKGMYTISSKPLVRCLECKYYQGVHRVQGHAPCSHWKSGGVMWNWYCSQGERYE